MTRRSELLDIDEERLLPALSDIPRKEVLTLGVIDFLVSLGFISYVLIELRNCCPWVLVLHTFHLWIWVFALGCANVRIDSVGFVYTFIGLLTVSFVIDLSVAIVELIIFIDDMKWQIIALYAFAIVFALLSIAQAIVCTTLANALLREKQEIKNLGLQQPDKKSKPIRGLVAVWISFDVLWFIIFWIVAALTLNNCCWWIILFAVPHLQLWLFALSSANSRIENPWLFYVYLGVSIMATGLDLTALVLSAFWFSSERNVLFAVWFVFFAGFLGLDIFNLLFSVGQIFAIRDEDKRSIEREYRSAAYTKKTR